MPSIGEAKSRMDESLEAVRREFLTVRTGKATPAMLDIVRVEAYGSRLPLNQVASIGTPEPTLLVLQPFDKSLIGDIERAIHQSGLGLNPANDGNVIRIPVPPLNEERRKEYVRILGKMAEEGRISIRQARRDGNEDVKSRMKDGEISDDEGHRQLDEIQKLTDEYTKRIDDLLANKEKEVMSI